MVSVSRLVLACALAALVVADGARAASRPLVIRGARLIDGTGAAPREVAIRIRDGRIDAIGPTLAADGAGGVDRPGDIVIDARGDTVIPGLVDAHVHLSGLPGSGQRGDPPAAVPELDARHLAAYVACGVTTVLDAGIAIETARTLRELLARDDAAPRVLMLGPPFVTPGGYASPPFPGVSTVDEVETQLDAVVRLGAAGVKVAIERGWSPLGEWPIHSPGIRAAIVRGAAARGLPIYVHATGEADQRIALDMAPHGLMHLVQPWTGEAVSDDLVQNVVRSGAYQVTTLSYVDAPLTEFHPDRLGDPLLQLVVPQEEVASARDPRVGEEFRRELVAMVVPWFPALLLGPLTEQVIAEDTISGVLSRSGEALRRLHAAGVPIVVGTDSGSGPYAFHGPTTLREIELVIAAGLSPAAALVAATRVPAEMLGLDAEIGTVEVGKRADLVVLGGDPLADPRAFRAVRWTVKDGVARTPVEWIERAP